jgi:hypothetical protein
VFGKTKIKEEEKQPTTIREKIDNWLKRNEAEAGYRLAGSGTWKLRKFVKPSEEGAWHRLQHLRLLAEQNRIMIEQNNTIIELLAERKE